MKTYTNYTTKDECVVTMFQITCSTHWNKMSKSMLLKLKKVTCQNKKSAVASVPTK